MTPPVTTAPKDPVDLDGDGITNNWLVGGKAAPAPGTPKAKVSSDKVKLKLVAAPKGAKKIRVYRADGKGGFKLVKTLTVKSKTFTDKKVKAGHTYKYKTVGVNAKGQQGKASGHRDREGQEEVAGPGRALETRPPGSSPARGVAQQAPFD